MRKLVFRERNFPQLKKIHYDILSYMVCWVAATQYPKVIQIQKHTGYWFSLDKIANDNNLSYQQVQRALFRLEGKDIYKLTPLMRAQMVHSHTEFNRLYFTFNFPRIFEMLENVQQNIRIINKIKERGMLESLFEIESDNIINSNADSIVKKILSKYPTLFKTRVGRTKTYMNACRIIKDIYDGTFLNPRVYDLHAINSVRWFNVQGWKDRLLAVKGNWQKVEELLLQAADNYVQMFDKKNMPQNKKLLPRSLEKWLYDVNNEAYSSYFILSFNKPNLTMKQYGEIKADKIFDTLPRQLQEVGNELHDILPKGTYQVVLWENIEKMWRWARMVMKQDSNAIYWFNSSADIVDKFLQYCKENNIIISPATLNIEKAMSSNAPFVWFVQDAIKKYGLNPNLCNCATEDDFERYYKA